MQQDSKTTATSEQQKSATVAALTITVEQWADAISSDESAEVSQLDAISTLESLDTADFDSLLQWFCIRGHTPWALSAWRRSLLQQKLPATSQTPSSKAASSSSSSSPSLSVYSMLALSHLRNAADLLLVDSESASFAAFTSRLSSSSSSPPPRSIALAHTLMQLCREEASSLKSLSLGDCFVGLVVTALQFGNVRGDDAAFQEHLRFWISRAVKAQQQQQKTTGGELSFSDEANFVSALWNWQSASLISVLAALPASALLAVAQDPAAAPVIARRLLQSADDDDDDLALPRLSSSLLDLLTKSDAAAALCFDDHVACVIVVCVLQIGSAQQQKKLQRSQWRQVAAVSQTRTRQLQQQPSRSSPSVLLDAAMDRFESSLATASSCPGESGELCLPLFDALLLLVNESLTPARLARLGRLWSAAVLEAHTPPWDTSLTPAGGVPHAATARAHCEAAFVTLCKAITSSSAGSCASSSRLLLVSRADVLSPSLLARLLLLWPESMWTLPVLDDDIALRPLARALIHNSENAAFWFRRFQRLLHTMRFFFRYGSRVTAVLEAAMPELLSISDFSAEQKQFAQFLMDCSAEVQNKKLDELSKQLESKFGCSRATAAADSSPLSTSLRNLGPWASPSSSASSSRRSPSPQSAEQQFIESQHRRFILDQAGRRLDDKFHQLMDTGDWSRALQLCASLAQPVVRQHQQQQQEQHRRGKSRGGKSEQSPPSSSSSSSSSAPAPTLSIALPSPWIWMAARRSVAVCFAAPDLAGAWIGAMKVLHSTRNLSGCTAPGAALYWRCAAVLRRCGRWEELMRLFAAASNSVPRIGDKGSSSSSSSSSGGVQTSADDADDDARMLLMAYCCSAVQKHTSKVKTSAVASVDSPREDKVVDLLLRFLAWARSKGLPHHGDSGGTEASPSSITHRQTTAALCVALHDRGQLAHAAALLVPLVKACPASEAVGGQDDAEQQQQQQRRSGGGGKLKPLYKDINTVFRRVVKHRTWPASEWQEGLRFARLIDRDDLVAELAANGSWEQQLSMWRQLIN